MLKKTFSANILFPIFIQSITLVIALIGVANARVDWRLERAYEGGGKELKAGLIIITLFFLGYLYIRYFSFVICTSCNLKTRGKASCCKHCGSELPKYD